MQKFSYHTHNNAFDIFDGHNTCSEMMTKAEEIGFEELGVSNHLIWHPNISATHKMFFSDINKAIDIFKRNIEQIRNEGLKHNLKVYAGFEVDYFPSVEWRNGFELIKKELEADYYIGSTHFIRNSEETKIYNIFHLYTLPSRTTEAELDALLMNYWLNIIDCVKSGYFSFIAHIDYCTIFNLCVGKKWDDIKWQVIETLAKYKHPVELNTGGYNRCNIPHPHPWMLAELAKRDVPIVISDDAHKTECLGQHFAKAEELLQSLNYFNRWKLNNAKF